MSTLRHALLAVFCFSLAGCTVYAYDQQPNPPVPPPIPPTPHYYTGGVVPPNYTPSYNTPTVNVTPNVKHYSTGGVIPPTYNSSNLMAPSNTLHHHYATGGNIPSEPVISQPSTKPVTPSKKKKNPASGNVETNQ